MTTPRYIDHDHADCLLAAERAMGGDTEPYPGGEWRDAGYDTPEATAAVLIVAADGHGDLGCTREIVAAMLAKQGGPPRRPEGR